MQDVKWWHDKVAYQIYPASFRDVNGDGFGDLKGITERLDYIRELGVDLIWVSPVYRSPMADKGYDISDYYGIDPRFGSMEDMEELIEEAGKREMKLLMDLVINHSSDEHEWFRKALLEVKQGKEGRYAGYYIFRDGRDGGPPSNWRSIFGGSAWERVDGTNRYYLHTFLKKQPDLNWDDEALREEIYCMVNWWLDKGLGGFRLDAIAYMKKPEVFMDGPADGDDGMCNVYQVCQNLPGIENIFEELKWRTFRLHDCFTVAEANGVASERLTEFMGEDGHFSTIFDFNYIELDIGENGWHDKKPVTAARVRRALFASQKEAGEIGFLSNVLENHDQNRVQSRFFPREDQGFECGSMLAVLQLFLRGIPFIYQGQEIGMTNDCRSRIEEFDDVATIDQYQRALAAGVPQKLAMETANFRSRDNARTPMQWDDTANAGFTDGMPWLPVNPNYITVNVKTEEADAGSLLHFYRRAIALRKSEQYREIFVYGAFEPVMFSNDNIIAYKRVWNGREVLVCVNFGGKRETIQDGAFSGTILLNNYDEAVQGQKEFLLKPYQAVVMEISEGTE